MPQRALKLDILFCQSRRHLPYILCITQAQPLLKFQIVLTGALVKSFQCTQNKAEYIYVLTGSYFKDRETRILCFLKEICHYGITDQTL